MADAITNPENFDPPPALGRGAFRLVALCSSAALGITLYMTLQRIAFRAALPGCGAGSACNLVTEGRWAYLAGMPVAYLGIAGYAAVLAGLFLLENRNMKNLNLLLWRALGIASLAGTGFIAWLFYLQWGVIGRFCPYCLSAHLLGLVAFGVLLRAAPFWRDRRRAALTVVTPATGMTLALITVHVLFVPDLTVAQSAGDLSLQTPGDTASSAGIRIGKKSPSRTVELLDGNLSFDVYKVPLIGDPQAGHTILELYDYTCPSCRKVSRLLDEYRKDPARSIAIIALPAPMDSACNPKIKNTLPVFQDACVYARLALAVRVADPAQFGEYHAWLMTGDLPPDPGKARAHAEELVGKEALEKAAAAPEPEQWIRDGLAIYDFLKAESLPKILAGNQVISSAGLAREKLYRGIEKGLEQLPAPKP